MNQRQDKSDTRFSRRITFVVVLVVSAIISRYVYREPVACEPLPTPIYVEPVTPAPIESKQSLDLSVIEGETTTDRLQSHGPSRGSSLDDGNR